MSLFGKNTRDEDEGPALGARPRNAPRGPAAAPDPTTPPAPRRRDGDAMANIGKSIQIKGDLTGNEDLQIEGVVEGRIDLPNNQLTIGAEGQVKADVNAKAVVVVGHVTGNVTGVDRVEVQATGVVDGDVAAPRLVVHEGAVLNGAVSMGASAAKAAGTSRPPEKKPASGEAAA